MYKLIIPETKPLWKQMGLYELTCKNSNITTLHRYDGPQTIDDIKIWDQYTCLDCGSTFAHNFTPEHGYMKKCFNKILRGKK